MYVGVVDWVFVMDDDDVIFDDVVVEDFGEGVFFVFVDFGGVFEVEVFFVGDFVDGVVGSQVVVENVEVCFGFDWLVLWVDDVLFGWICGIVFYVF